MKQQAISSPKRSSAHSISINASLINELNSEPITSRNIRHDLHRKNLEDEQPASKPSVQHMQIKESNQNETILRDDLNEVIQGGVKN